MTSGPRQRSLVNRRVRFRDGVLEAKYVFPFWDSTWTVRFILIDIIGGTGPRVARTPMTFDGSGLHADALAGEARPLTTMMPDEFHGTYHFDPWWVFRGMGGVADRYRSVVLPTNIARPFRFEGSEMKVHDVEFGPQLTAAVRIEAKDPLYRLKTLEKGTFDLEGAFGPTVTA